MSAERLTLNGVEYVPLSEFEAEQDRTAKFRRTLAVAHSILHFELDSDRVVALIERDTGWTVEDAEAIRQVIAWAKSATPPIEASA